MNRIFYALVAWVLTIAAVALVAICPLPGIIFVTLVICIILFTPNQRYRAPKGHRQ